jgi:hypothetical protein
MYLSFKAWIPISDRLAMAAATQSIGLTGTKLISGISTGASGLGVLVGALNLRSATNTEGKVQALADLGAAAAGFTGVLGTTFSAAYSFSQLSVVPLTAPAVDATIGGLIHYEDEPGPLPLGVGPNDMGAPP